MAVRRLGGAVPTGNRGAARLLGPLLYDSFNRVNGTAIAASACDTGQIWSGSVNSVISSGTAAPAGGFGAEETQISTGSTDYTVQCTVMATDFTHFPLLNARYVDVNNTLLLQQNDSTHYYLGIRVAGAYTQLALPAGAPTVGDILKIKVAGTTVTAWVNATQIYSGTPTGLSTTSTKIALGQNNGGTGRFGELIVVPN